MNWPRGHPLTEVLVAASSGSFPPVDGVVDVLPPDDHGTEAIVEFTGHTYVLTTRAAGDDLFLGVDAFGGATSPRFVVALAGDAEIGSHDAVLTRAGGADVPSLTETDRYDDHPRVRRARRHRRAVSVMGDERGVVTIGRGLVDRVELSVELSSDWPDRSAGAGRALILAGLATLSEEQVVFAQIAPGNAASLRAFLACGFRPIGSEILIDRSGWVRPRP